MFRLKIGCIFLKKPYFLIAIKNFLLFNPNIPFKCRLLKSGNLILT